MSDFDTPEIALNTADEYVAHLAHLSEFIQIIAKEDICNEFGVLLVPKGTPIKQSIAKKLTGHQMTKTIDEMVSIEKVLSNQQIHNDIEALLESYPDFQQIHLTAKFSNRLKHLTTVHSIPRLLLQKLTVLKERINDVYQRALFTAWFGAIVATEMRLESTQIHNTFLVGLYHDLGLLHIPAEIVALTSFDEHQWKIMETHVFISQQIVSNAYLYSDEISKALIQHHERCDGTGYPKKLSKSKLTPVGQIIGMSDMFYNIRTREFSKSEKNLLDLKPYLQVNTETYFLETYKATHAILTRSGLTSENSINKANFLQFAQRLLSRSRQFQEIKVLAHQLLTHIDGIKLGKHGKALVASIHNITRIVERSGLIGGEIEQWLQSIKEQDYESSVNELLEIESLQQELLWLAKKVSRSIPIFFRDELPTEISSDEKFRELNKTIGLLLKESWKD